MWNCKKFKFNKNIKSKKLQKSRIKAHYRNLKNQKIVILYIYLITYQSINNVCINWLHMSLNDSSK